MMSGDSEFNEIFFSNLRVPVDRVLGRVNEGWNVAITALSNERPTWASGCTWPLNDISTPWSSRRANCSGRGIR